MNELTGEQVNYSADEAIDAALGRIGRTEDIKFSPDGRMLAIAGLRTNRILLLGIELDLGASAKVVLRSALEIDSSSLDGPHGLVWLDDRTVMVANRTGDLTIFAIPPTWPASGQLNLEPAHIFGPDMGGVISTPGSLSMAELGGGLVELLVCNNYVHNVSRHLLDRTNGYVLVASETLLHEKLDVPDGIAHCPAGRWIAVSNHTNRTVGLYRNDDRLDRHSEPDAVLNGISYPHGLKFVAGGRALLVADAGWPFVHLFTTDGEWEGEIHPARSIRVMDETTFRDGQFSLQEGGPKGLDVTADGRLMVTTCQKQPLAFFDLRSLQLPEAWEVPRSPDDDAQRSRAILLAYLAAAERRMHEAVGVARDTGRSQLERLEREFRESHSWRITAPMRWMMNQWLRMRASRGSRSLH